MADNDDVPGSPDRDAEATGETVPTAARPVVPAESAGPAPVLKARWRDRVWSFRAIIAVALASLLIGGVTGGVIGAVAADDDRDGHYRMGPWDHDGPMPPGWRERGPRHFRGDGGPGWRWQDGPQEDSPQQPSPPVSPPSSSSPGPTG
jgi:hypothetical protein